MPINACSIDVVFAVVNAFSCATADRVIGMVNIKKPKHLGTQTKYIRSAGQIRTCSGRNLNSSRK